MIFSIVGTEPLASTAANEVPAVNVVIEVRHPRLVGIPIDEFIPTVRVWMSSVVIAVSNSFLGDDLHSFERKDTNNTSKPPSHHLDSSLIAILPSIHNYIVYSSFLF